MFKKLLFLIFLFITWSTQLMCAEDIHFGSEQLYSDDGLVLPFEIEQVALGNKGITSDGNNYSIDIYGITFEHKNLYYAFDCSNLRSADAQRIKGKPAKVSYGIYMIVDRDGHKGLFVFDNVSQKTTFEELDRILATEEDQSYIFLRPIDMMPYDKTTSIAQNGLIPGILIYAVLESSDNISQNEFLQAAKWYRAMIDWINNLKIYDKRYWEKSWEMEEYYNSTDKPIDEDEWNQDQEERKALLKIYDTKLAEFRGFINHHE